MVGVLPEKLSRSELKRLQGERLAALVKQIIPANRFYTRKFGVLGGTDFFQIEWLKNLPFTTKAELVADQAEHPKFGSNLTFPLEAYSRMHQTSGTSGRPLRWLDTPESWGW